MIQRALKFLFDSAGGQLVAVFALVAALFGAWQLDRAGQRSKGAENAKVEINAAAHELANKGRAAAAAVPADGENAERLRERYCRDC